MDLRKFAIFQLQLFELVMGRVVCVMCSPWDGSLSWSDFRLGAIAFADRWNKFSSILPQCFWLPSPQCHSQGQGYLSLENVLLRSSIKEDHIEESEVRTEEACCSGQEADTVDDASLVQSYGHEIHRFDFHIVYSSTYKVPLLYFRGYHIDGQPLALDDIEKYLSADSTKLLMESKWTFITQEEHPYLNRPWYTLHPCGTSEWIKLLIEVDSSQGIGALRFEKYLFSWFSVVGQVFDLRIPLQMLTSFDEV